MLLLNAIQFQLGHQTLYTYSAAGTKLKVVDKTAPAGVNLPVSSLDVILANPSVASTATTDYVGNMIYLNGSLQMILLPEGYWQAGVYYYYLKDHLGSNRVVMKSDGSVVESSNFYPSGMRFGESVASGGSVQPYRHIGKEMQTMHGLNWYDNGARMRQVDLPVWTTVDPLAEKYYSISPYAYCAGNLINSIDIDGNIIVNWHACSDASYRYVEKMPNNGDMNRIDLYQHSTSTKGNVIVAPYFHGNIASPTPIYPSDIKNGKYFGEMMKYSAPEAWNNIIENGGTLVLHVCFSGVDGGIAQMISKANRNILVIAPDGYDVIQSNGVDLGPFYSYDEKTGKASNPGKWIYYRNGKRLPYTGTQSKGGKYIKFEGCAVECNASTQEVDYEKYNQDLLEQTSPRQQDRLHVGENGYEGSYWATDDYLRQFGKPDKKKIQ